MFHIALREVWVFWILWRSFSTAVKVELHSNLDLVRVSGMVYTKSRLTLKLSKCKQSGPYELLFAEWKRVQKMCPLARSYVLLIKNVYECILNFFSKIIIFVTTKLVFDDFFSNWQLFTFTITSGSLSSTRLYMRSVIRYLFNVHFFGASSFTSFISSYFSLNDNRRLFVFSDIVLTFNLAYQKHLRSR